MHTTKKLIGLSTKKNILFAQAGLTLSFAHTSNQSCHFQNPPSNVVESMVKVLQSGQRNGYAPSTGYPDARAAVAKHVSKNPNIR
jgi:aspartate/methionine/tyrosine aminotransferase